MGLSSQFYDVIVVGAGPAGSYIACELASSGYSVAAFEQKAEPGLNACCTGIISAECLESLDPGKDTILTEVKSAEFHSPSGRCLRFHTENVQAYVVDRVLLDKVLACKAQSKGANYFFSWRVLDILPGKDTIAIAALCSGTRAIFSARAAVLANGFMPGLPHRLGLGRIKHFLIGAQAEIEATDIDQFEVHFGQSLAPGGFAWLVPISSGKAYVGLLATSQAKLYLQNFLDSLLSQGSMTSRDTQIGQRAVPMGILPRSYGDRLLVVGDAAGQVKPTTGGGIYFGHLGAQIAARVLRQALASDNLTAGELARYQKQWKAKMGKEISRGYWARWAYGKLSDSQIEGIFETLDSNGLAGTLFNPGGFSFDWHSKLITTILRRSSTYPLRRMKALLSGEVGS
jgi:digeranylgeranylglycerophospholipid reductase